jgi:hypothetical protein
MMNPLSPHPLSTWLRLLLGIPALALIVAIFIVMANLYKPSQFVHAQHLVEKGPGTTSALKSMPVLDFNQLLYLAGPIQAAAGKQHAQLFHPETEPVLSPAVLTDSTGAVEVLAHTLPLTAEPPQSYFYNETLHLLGWHTTETGFTLFAVAKSRDSLERLLSAKSEHWKRILFTNGLWLAGLVFSAFWLLNMSVLSYVALRLFELLIVNVVFLVLLYSVLLLSAYPLQETWLNTIFILVIANAVFIPLSLLLHPRSKA